MKDILRAGCARTLLLTLLLATSAVSLAAEQVVFGSFQNSQNANNWASRVGLLLNAPIAVERVERDDGIWYRVVSTVLTDTEARTLKRVADAKQLRYWRLSELGTSVVASTRDGRSPIRNAPPVRPTEDRNAEGGRLASRRGAGFQSIDLDLGLETKTFFETGIDGQSRFHPALSLQLDLYRNWDNERQSFTLAPFYRFDAEDPERTHFDVREAFWTRVGNDWDLHLGVK